MKPICQLMISSVASGVAAAGGSGAGAGAGATAATGSGVVWPAQAASSRAGLATSIWRRMVVVMTWFPDEETEPNPSGHWQEATSRGGEGPDFPRHGLPARFGCWTVHPLHRFRGLAWIWVCRASARW